MLDTTASTGKSLSFKKVPTGKYARIFYREDNVVFTSPLTFMPLQNLFDYGEWNRQIILKTPESSSDFKILCKIDTDVGIEFELRGFTVVWYDTQFNVKFWSLNQTELKMAGITWPEK